MFCQYVLLLVAAASVVRVTCDDRPAVIYHLKSEDVLDGREDEVKLQPYNGSQSQKWKMEFAGSGRHFFKNMASGKYLDIKDEVDTKAKTITSKLNGGVMQQWFVNSDGTIESAAPGGFVLDVKDNKIEPGTDIIIFPKHDEDYAYNNQKFIIDRPEILNRHE